MYNNQNQTPGYPPYPNQPQPNQGYGPNQPQQIAAYPQAQNYNSAQPQAYQAPATPPQQQTYAQPQQYYQQPIQTQPYTQPQAYQAPTQSPYGQTFYNPQQQAYGQPQPMQAPAQAYQPIAQRPEPASPAGPTAPTNTSTPLEEMQIQQISPDEQEAFNAQIQQEQSYETNPEPETVPVPESPVPEPNAKPATAATPEAPATTAPTANKGDSILIRAMEELEKDNKRNKITARKIRAPMSHKAKVIFRLAVLLLIIGGSGAFYAFYYLPQRKVDDGKLAYEYYYDQTAPTPFFDEGKQLYGYKSPDGKEVLIEPEYHYASIFRGDVAFVSKDEKGAFIDRKGKIVTKVDKAKEADFDDEGKIYNANFKIYNQKGYLISDKTSASNFASHGFYTSKDSENKTILYNRNAEEVYDCQGECKISVSKISYGDDKNFYALINYASGQNSIVNLNNGETIFSNSKPLTAPVDETIPKDKDRIREANGLYFDGEANAHHNIIVYKGKITADINSNYDVRPVYGQTGIFEIYPISKNAKREKYYYDAVNNKELAQLTETEHAAYRAHNLDVRACGDSINSYSLYKDEEAQIACGLYTGIDGFSSYANLYFNKRSQNAVILKQGLTNQIYDLNSKKELGELPEASSITQYTHSPILLLEYEAQGKKYLYNFVANKSTEINKDAEIEKCYNTFCIDKAKQNHYAN